jgi:hypothetical protein
MFAPFSLRVSFGYRRFAGLLMVKTAQWEEMVETADQFSRGRSGR